MQPDKTRTGSTIGAGTLRRQRLNLVLAAVALGLITLILVDQHKSATKAAPLTSLKAESIDHILIHHDGAADVVLQKTAGRWQLSAPVLAAADSIEVAGLTALAQQQTASTLDPKDVKPKDLGLEPPGFSVTLNNLTLDFGGVESLSGRRYVATGGKIYLIDDPSANTVGSDYAHLLAKSLLPAGDPITAVAVPGLTVARSADGKSWTLTPPDPQAGADAPQKLVDAWAAVQSDWNTAAVPPASAAAPPENATVTLKSGQAITFRIVSRNPQLVLEREDLKVQYNLAGSEADHLLKLAAPGPPASAAPGGKAAAPPAPAAQR